MPIANHVVPQLESPVRLQEYEFAIFSTIPSRSAFKKAIKKGLILIDGKVGTTATLICGGETISLLEDKDQYSGKPFMLKLEIVYEDEHLAVIHKPAGVVVSGNKFATIKNALPQNLYKSNVSDAVVPQPVHRLDYPTSGLLLIGKTSSGIVSLNRMFALGTIQKTYLAVTIGDMRPKGVINLPIDNKEAVSEYEVLQCIASPRFKKLNLVQLTPKTGRKHQLRKHLFSIGNPIFGDKEYYLPNLVLNGKGLYLHASKLCFEHPVTQEKLYLQTPPPLKFKKLFDIIG